MPQRPSKKVKRQPNAKSDIVKGLAGGDQAAQQRHREKVAQTILGRYQGRKSIERA
ncbi:MAG: hypothetical protein ABJF10_08370 [Chthoniobacter sp.]|uniref:hypothetical protein n=1 Tax=Chthoniobacter sp. TaxID=2510640 RepID=UPI0032A6152C